MPTVVRQDGFSIRIYAPPREHPPGHVHVFKAGTEVVVLLGGGEVAPSVIEAYRMSESDIEKAVELVVEYHDLLVFVWRSLHG